MYLTDYVHTFGQVMQETHGQRVHKIAIDATFTCPNRDGTRGWGGCTFCNNSSFSPHGRQPATVAEQIEAGRQVIRKRTGARRYMAYFQAYTNTYADPIHLQELYNNALAEPDVIGLSIGTRPDCVPPAVLDLLAGYRQQGYEIWLELGLQSSFDKTLQSVNRGHGYDEYRTAVRAARARGLSVCTHLIIGLPGETAWHNHKTLERVVSEGVDGLKLHPLHVVKGTQLANQWRGGEYQPLTMTDYIRIAADLVELTPPEIIFHRLTGTANESILLAPRWCSQKWRVLNGIARELQQRGTVQGSACREKFAWNQ